MPKTPNQLAKEAQAAVPKAAKVAYVKSQHQTRNHHCHWPGCNKQVPPALWGCYEHWMMLPKHLRNRIWEAYKPGQEINLTPSHEYLDVAHEVQKWIALNYPTVCIACGGSEINSQGGPCIPCQRRKQT